MKKYFLLLIAGMLFFMPFAHSQVVYHHVSNQGIYDFLDEMANNQVIDLFTGIKPYSRKLIANKLAEINEKRDLLNTRQKKELDFYLRDFCKELPQSLNIKKRIDAFSYRDSLFTITINPIAGLNFYSNESGTNYHRWWGAEAYGYVGSHWGVYASLRDNFEKERVSMPEMLNQRIGAAYKDNEYSEMRGGITYSNKWLSVAMIKDHFEWGTNYNGANIFSPKPPSFATITIQARPVKWFEFNYIHGWMVSGLVDSLRTYTFNSAYAQTTREVYRNKFMVANMFTFKPWGKLNLSIGNSAMYSDVGFNPAYIIPVFFYKSLDHTYAEGNYGGQNAQMFFDMSCRLIKHLHIYSTIFVDEIAISRMWNKEDHSNFVSIKAGGALSDFPLKNVSLIAEYTRTNPLVYQHIIPTTNFNSNGFNLGHYLRDNSDEIYLSMVVKPWRALRAQISYTHARKGKDYNSLGGTRLGLPFMDEVVWDSESILLKTQFQIINDAWLNLACEFSDINGPSDYTPQFNLGKKTTFLVGFNYGF